MILTLGKKKCREGLNVYMNYEFNLLHHVGVVAKRVCAAHEGDDNTPSGPMGRGVKSSSRAIAPTYQKIFLKIPTWDSSNIPWKQRLFLQAILAQRCT